MIKPTIKKQDESFDPALFGFDTSYTKSRRGGHVSLDDDYLFYGRGRGNTKRLTLCLSASTASLIEELYGDRVDFAPNQNGQILVYSGNGRKLSISSKSKDKKKSRASICVDKMANDYIALHGEFRKRLLDVDIYANGKALIFTPLATEGGEE